MKKSQKQKKKTSRHPIEKPVSGKREYQAMALIAALCIVVFGRNITFTYILVDLPKMIFENPHIITGLSWENLWWAFTQPNLALYQPLPNLTFMLESHLFGGWPGGYHSMTLLWHIACMCLFLWVMMRLTNNFTVVFSATLLMAVHPVQTLVVSQIAPRNEIMQAFFMLLSIEAYRRYVQKGSYKAYLCSVVLMGLGLLCKQIIVMLPVVLLLLDYWPFHRIEISFRNFRNTTRNALVLVAEKAPWFAVSLLGVFFAFYGKMQYDQIRYHVSKLTVPDAVYFIITGYARYLGHLLYPVRISYFEVYGEERILWFFLVSATVLFLITVTSIYWLWKRPYLIVGWLWFVALLFPVSGVIRYMLESIALRYLYAPAMGVYITVFLGLYELVRRLQPDKEPESQPAETQNTNHDKMPQWYWIGVGLATAILATLAFWQNGFLRDTESGVMRMQKVTGDRSAMGHGVLAVIRFEQERIEEAEEHFQRALEIQPEGHVFRYKYAGALYAHEKYQKVIEVMKPAVEDVPDAFEYLELYALGLMATGRLPEARKHLEKALEIQSNQVSLLQNLAYCLILQGNYKDAQPYLEKGLRLDPESPALLQLKEMASSVMGSSSR
jgi:protein O-mannosyl-transferase